MTALRFPTKAEQAVRAELLRVLDEHAWVGLVFLWQGATVPEGARRNGALMRFNIRSSIVGCGLTELTACLIFGGVPFDVRVPYDDLTDARVLAEMARIDRGTRDGSIRDSKIWASKKGPNPWRGVVEGLTR